MPEDISAACIYLASDEASYVTGTTIHVNGGMGMFLNKYMLYIFKYVNSIIMDI